MSASTWRELWEETTEVVGNRVEARWLCEEASGWEGDEFLEIQSEPATMRMGVSLQKMVGRRLAGEPIQYVLGHWSFRHLDLFIDTRVLIPRPETELLAEEVIQIGRKQHGELAGSQKLRVADLGTGSGAIGLAVAQELPSAGVEVWLTDASPDALDVARANIAGIGRHAPNVQVSLGNWCEALPAELRGTFHIIVSNPPYIDTADTEVADEVRKWEPGSALFAADNGLRDLFSIAQQAKEWLHPGGWLLLEFGHTQALAVSEELKRLGYINIEVKQDLARLNRFVIAQKEATG